MPMPFTLNFYRDQVATDGATATPLPAAHRLLYVRHGRVVMNDKPMRVDDAAYVDGAVALKSAGEWSELWRWELAQPNAAPALYEGTGVLSMLRMARIISNLVMNGGTRWLLRLDQITAGAVRIADRHQHPGPGIRCLKEGTFNVQQDAESARDLAPGDAWWETGTDTVIAWSSRQMAAKFLRGMVLPPEWEGRATGTWLSAETAAPPTGTWKLYVDHVIAV
jgi:hypothetical protein